MFFEVANVRFSSNGFINTSFLRIKNFDRFENQQNTYLYCLKIGCEPFKVKIFMLKKFKFTLLLLLCIDFSLYAQTPLISSTDSSVKVKPMPKPIVKRPKPITKESSVGLRLNTDGWSFIFESGKAKSQDLKRIDMFHDVRILQFEFNEKRHPKELRMYGWDRNQQSDKMYAFGKVNNFYSLKFNIGMRKMIAGKPYPKSVSVHLVYAGGLTLGLLKPYYVDAYTSKDGGATFELAPVKFTPENSQYFLDPLYVVGSSGFTKGLGEMKIIPGLHLKSALHFDYTPNKFKVAALEVGATAEYYTKKIEMVASQKPVAYFFNLYAGIQFGGRRR